jgi:zinc protease
MNRTYRTLSLAFIIFCSGMFASAQDVKKLSLSSPIPVNPKVKIGVLKNGIKYYIMENMKPEHRMEMRLAVNAGSVLETDEQRGLAHFCEHMAFNGTKNFKKDELVKYLESIGVRFGNDLNAYTSFDETVYMLQIPTDKPELMEKGFQVIEDWAHNVSYDDEEIDKERGVIIEEWRSGKGAEQRMRDKQFPVLFHDSKYAVRLPIGLPEILNNFSHETLKSFYRDWYRPDLMAVVVVGDFDEATIEQKVIAHFENIAPHVNEPARKSFDIPDHAATLFTIATDPEATSTNVGLIIKHDRKPEEKLMDYRGQILDHLFASMLNDRYSELALQSNPPFLYAGGSYGRFLRPRDAFTLSAGTKEDGVERGLEALLTEAYRVEKHGFTESELERAKTNVLRSYEQLYNEREKTNSANYAREFVSNFLTGESMPGLELEYELHKKYMTSINVGEINKLAKEYMSEKNRVVTLTMPQKEGLRAPTENDLKAVIDAVAKKQIEPYVDQVSRKPLAQVADKGVKVASEKKIDELGLTEWTLSNGIKVVLKPTDFKNDEILIAAVSPGGSSLVADADILSASLVSNIVQMSGVGEFDAVQLRKILTGKVAVINPWIGETQEGFSGNCSPKDLETALQLIYLDFTAPRKDTAAYSSFFNRIKSALTNMGSAPEAVFRDTLNCTLAQYHPRRRPLNVERLSELDHDKALAIYKDRFADASDFTFFFVGAFDMQKIKPMIEKYLGALPVINRKESFKDNGIHPPKGVVDRAVKKGIDQKSMVCFAFTGPSEWSYANRYNLLALQELLNIKLREEIREEKGGTYGVGVRATMTRIPRQEYTVMVQFGCNPSRVDELSKTAMDVLKKVLNEQPANEDVAKIKELNKRERETNLKENNWWIGRLQAIYANGDDVHEINAFNEQVEKLSAGILHETAAKYLHLDNYVHVVLYPEKAPEKN